MGSGRGKIKPTSIPSRTRDELRRFNEDKLYTYFFDLTNNVAFQGRDEAIQKEIASKPRNAMTFKELMDRTPVDVAIYPNTFRDHSAVAGDKILNVDPRGGFPVETWVKAFQELGGKVGIKSTWREAYEHFGDYGLEGYIPPNSEATGEIYRSMMRAGNLTRAIIKKAFQNLAEGESPYADNERAQGYVTYEEGKNSLTTQANNVIGGRAHYLTEKFNELYNTFTDVYPNNRFVRALAYTPNPKDNSMASFDFDVNRIRVNANVLDPSYDKANASDKYFTVALATKFPLVEVLTHEFGHAIHFYMMKQRVKNPEMDKAFKKHGDLFLFDPRNPFDPSKAITTLEAVSPYGNQNKMEAFAEAFSMYVAGGEPTYVGVTYFSKFQELMKDLKLDKYKGMMRTTLPSEQKPERRTVVYELNGKKFNKIVTDTMEKRGYFVVRYQGIEYTIDANTQAILKKTKVT